MAAGTLVGESPNRSLEVMAVPFRELLQYIGGINTTLDPLHVGSGKSI